MRLLRLVGLVATSTLMIGAGGQSLATGSEPSRHTASTRPSIAEFDAANSAAIAAALHAARSPRWGAAQLRSTELAAISPGGPPTSLQSAAGAGCDFGEGGGSASSVSSPDGISLNRSVFSELVPAGNLDRKPGRDVLDYRLGGGHHTISAGVTARSGRSGAVLWSRLLPGDKNGLSIPFPDPDVVSGHPGVLLIEETQPLFLESGTGTVTLRVRAISGSGMLLWSRTMTGQITQTGNTQTLTDVPILTGDVHDVAGRGHDLLVDVLNGTLNLHGESGSDQAEIISAVDGSVALRGPAASSTAGIPEVVPVPDLNRDGLDDLAAIDPGTDGVIVAERGDTGAMIWTSTGVPVDPGAQLVPVGRLGKSRVGDLVVTNETFTHRRDRTTASLVNGATGTSEWTHAAVCAFEIGKTGPTLRPAVGLLASADGGSGSRLASAYLRLAPRDRHGKVMFRRTVSARVHVKKPASSAAFGIDVAPFGDVEPDGSQDLLVRMSATVGKHTKRLRGVVRGRNGALIKEHIGIPTDGGLHSGRGTDSLKEQQGKHGVVLSAYDAATGRLLYKRHIARSHALQPGIAFGIRVTGHGCSDVVVGAQSNARELIGLFDGHGDPLWTVTAPAPKLRGGTVHRSKAPMSYCA